VPASAEHDDHDALGADHHDDPLRKHVCALRTGLDTGFPGARAF